MASLKHGRDFCHNKLQCRVSPATVFNIAALLTVSLRSASAEDNIIHRVRKRAVCIAVSRRVSKTLKSRRARTYSGQPNLTKERREGECV